MSLPLDCDREDDGRRLAAVAELTGVLAYAASANEALTKAQAWHFATWRRALSPASQSSRDPYPGASGRMSPPFL